jgi:hypothetical protein
MIGPEGTLSNRRGTFQFGAGGVGLALSFNAIPRLVGSVAINGCCALPRLRHSLHKMIDGAVGNETPPGGS